MMEIKSFDNYPTLTEVIADESPARQALIFVGMCRLAGVSEVAPKRADDGIDVDIHKE